MAESMLELQGTMKPLTTFINAEVLEDTLPSLGQDHVILDIGAHGSPNLLGSKPQQELKGSCQRYICSGPWHRVFKTHSHHPGSESITHPNPEGRVTAGGDQWLMKNTSTRGHRDCKIHMWGQPTP